MIRPKVGEDAIDIHRGTGAIGSAIDKLRLDPASYIYQKFKTSGNPYLNDEYWTEAAKRGETNALIDLLAKNTEKSEKTGEPIKNVYYDKLMRDYSQFADYDEYMLSLSIPYLDNTNSIERFTDNGIKIGDYTDQEWAVKVMEESFKRHDAEVIEEQKKNMAWWKKALATIGSAASSVVGGASQFVQDIWNLGEGLINMFTNFSNDDDWGDRFLYAFQNDDYNEPFAVIADRFNAVSYDLMHDYTSGVNAVAAYEAGYRDMELSEILGPYGLVGKENSVGVSYTNWGKIWHGLWDSIGYMLPSILLSGGVSSALGKAGISTVAPKLTAAATKLAGTGTFYAGIFSGNVSETLDYASMNGISYKDLNSGNVIGNAALKAVGQLVVEEALGKLIGFGTSARLRGQINAAKTGAIAIGDKSGKAFISWAKRALKDAGREGLEEVLQDMSDSFINFIYGETGSEAKLRDFYKGQAKETFTVKNLAQSFFLGGLTSIIIGSFNTLTHVPQSKRALGTDFDGKAYRLGVFQTINFNEALKTMNEWNNILNDPKANKEAKQLAALKMSLTMNSLGEVMRSFGETDAYKANQALLAYAESENRKEKIKAMSPHYAQDLFEAFAKEYTWAELQRDTLKKTTLKEKIILALDKVKNKLQKKNVTKIDNIITPDTKINKANEIDKSITSEIMSPEISENANRILASTKAEAVVAVDGNVVTKSGDILIVGTELLESMDNAKILSAEAYDQVVEEVRLKLTGAQRKMILKEYNKIVGVEGNIEDAITALLFDKQFYTKILLLSGERGYHTDAIEMLATIDGLVKAKAASNLRAGAIDMNAYNTLMYKVYNNMRDGLVTYATQFANLDLGAISNAVLPIEIKNQIRKNSNVIFTNDTNTGINNAKSGTIVASDVERFDFYIEKFQSYIDGESYKALRNKVKSANLNERLDAWGSLITLARLYGNKIDNVNLGKLTYLPAPKESLSELESGYVAILEDNFGDTLENLANDISNISKMSPEVKELLRNKDMNNRADRHYIVAEALFQISNHTMTIDEEFRPLRVISKADFLIDRYLGKNGTTNLFKDLLKDKIKTVADLVKDKTNIPKVILDTKIDYINGNIKGMRSENSDSIVVGNLANVDTLMHELTHVTQEIIYKNIKDSDVIRGGSDLLIKTMEYDEAKRLNQYLAKNFPITYALFRDKTQHSSFADVAYHLLQGELEANVSLDTYLPSMGFTYKNDYKILVSPDKKETFKLGTGTIKAKTETPAMLTKKTATKATPKSLISEDAILTESDRSKLDILANSITPNDKTDAIKEVNDNTLYKGMNARGISDFDPTKGNKSRITEKGSWFSLNQEVSKTYYNTKQGEATLYSAKGNISNPFVVDAKGQYFSNIDGLTGDQIATYAKEHGYDSVVIKNVLDIGPNILNADRKLAIKPSTDVVIFDNNLLTDIREIKIDKSGKIEGKSELSQLNKPMTLEDLLNTYNNVYSPNAATNEDMFGNYKISNDEKVTKLFNELTDNAKVIVNNEMVSLDVPLTPNEEVGKEFGENIGIYQLSPKSHFRLMGVEDADFERVAEHQSNSSLYHLAGDSIVVDVLKAIFDKMYSDKIITKPVRLIELFAGYGSQNLALKYLGKDYQTWKIAEWATKSIQAYKDMHHYDDNIDYVERDGLTTKKQLVDYLFKVGVSFDYNNPASLQNLNNKSFDALKTIYNNIQATHNLVNIQTVDAASLDIRDTANYDYLMTYSFPCQDLSQAGLRKGMDEIIRDSANTEQETRSAMLWQVDRIIKDLYNSGKPMPKILLMENVPQILQKRNEANFNKWWSRLESYGYTNSVQVLNAADYGVPQARQRAFMVSILGDTAFTFPEAKPLTRTVQDVVEAPSDEFRLTPKRVGEFMGHTATFLSNTTHHYLNRTVAQTIITRINRRATGGNYQSPNIGQNIDVYNLMHPKTDGDLAKTKAAIAKLKAGKSLSDFLSEERVIKPKETEETEETEETKEARYISNKVAAQSNLKYFVKKGRPIQLDPDVRDFVINTTQDFDKLPRFLKSKIQNGTLSKFDILGYVATANNIDDYTFKQIATNVFKNEELAKITYKDMRELGSRIEQLATLAYLAPDPYVKMTPDEMLDYNKEVMDKIINDSEFKKIYDKKNKKAITTKISGTTVDAYADEDQLNPLFFRHYDGTLASLRNINNIGKFVTAMQTIGAETELTQDVEAGNIASDTWNWSLKKRKSDITYEYDDVAKTLDTLDRQEKINAIEDYISETISKRLEALPIDQRKQLALGAMKKLETEINKLYSLSDAEIDKRYLIATKNMLTGKNEINEVTKEVPLSEQPRTTKNIKDELRNVGRNITRRIAGLKSRYNSLPTEVKQYIDPKTYKLTADYRSLSDAELEILLTAFKAANKQLTQRIRSITTAEKTTAQLRQRIEKMSQKLERAKTEVEADSKKTLREKVQVEYKTKIKEQTFEFVTPVEANDQVRQLLNTNWNKKRMSKVKGLTNNTEYDIANGKQFYAENADILMSGDTAQMEDTLRWFLSAKMNNVTDPEYRKFQAIRLYTFLFAYQQAKATGLYPNLNPNLKTQIEDAIRNEKSTAGTLLSISLDSLESMKAAEMVIDGITLPADIKGRLFDAIESNDIAFITKTQQEIMKYVADRKTAKKDIARKIVSVRSMAMLSSPLTWLRNKVSNFMLKRINKLSSAIGNKLWSKDSRGQLKLNKQITPEIQNYIAKNFIDNKLFDNLVSHLSKYNPSDISEWYKDATGKATKQAIMAKMVIKSLYNQYYNENMFKSKFMNSVHQKLMQAMSDDSYVREATLRYFGKILAEKGYDLKKIQEDANKNNSDAVTDNIMNDFATAVGLGLGDYMHSDNFFNKIETSIANSSDLGWFAYKMLLPYASASWNWFKEAIKMSPIGLGKAIVDTVRFEKRVAKLEADWQAGKSQISPELAQYMVRRDLGKGVIGTILWGLGALLAGLGWIKLEDDDYGTPKLRIGNLAIDISSIFGSSSLLAGAALITGLNDNGMTWDGFLDGLNRMADVTIEGFPLMQIVEMDMYSEGTWDIGMNQLESIALSFIPNIISWIAGATYPGKVKKNTFLEKAAAKIPFLGNTLYQKADPYTGKTKSWWEAFNRFVPYISIVRASENELKTEKLGLNKKELRGKYTINNETFTVTGKDLVALNEAYGKWNAIDLEKFYQNQMQVKIKVNNEYKMLTYNQMTDEQRRTAVNTIMSNNAEIAKIQAWTSQGNKYYASAELYKKLIEREVTTNVYRGTKGFVKK